VAEGGRSAGQPLGKALFGGNEMLKGHAPRNARVTLQTLLMVAVPMGAIIAFSHADPISGSGTPSAKATALVGNLNMLSAPTATAAPQWVPIGQSTLHMASQKDVFCNLSLEVGLYTNTFVASGGTSGGGGHGGSNTTSSATADAAVKVRIW